MRSQPATLALAACLGCGILPVAAQSTGSFVVPAIRSGGGTAFAFWNAFANPPGSPFNFQHPNPPGLVPAPAGADSAGNLTNVSAPRAVLVQTGSPTCFITSSGALYDFRATTSFDVRWAAASGDDPVTSVIFQTLTGGSRFDIDNVRLHWTDAGGAPQQAAPAFRALDDPQTGSFTERLVSAFQWDLTGRGVRSFRIAFGAPGDSMPLWQAQLDVVAGRPFQQQLGSLLLRRAVPDVRFGTPGRIEINLPATAETRFFLPGQQVPLTAAAEFGWEHTGWLVDGRILPPDPATLTFGTTDRTVAALFAPLDYAAWRSAMFFRANALLGRGDDHGNDAVSGPQADPDGDGLTNFAEFAFAGDPYAADRHRAAVQPLPASPGVPPRLRWRQGPSPLSAVTFTVQRSRDLLTWSGSPEDPVAEITAVEPAADGSTMVTATLLDPPVDGRPVFLRVVADTSGS